MLDIKLTPVGDVDFSSGDIYLSEPTEQHKRDLILSTQGSNKEFPTVGIGAINYIHDREPTNFMRAVRKEFSRDGMKVREVSIKNGELITDAAYENHRG